MALVATPKALDGIQSYSVGPLRIEYQDFTIISGDVSGTITASKLHSVIYCQIHGVGLTSAPTYSGATVTLAFADPAASRSGQIMLIGK